MKKAFIKYIEEPVLKEPVLIVGLPGVGNVAKLAAEYLINELPTKKLGILFSPHFPYHVVISEEGIIRVLNNEFSFLISDSNRSDLIIMRGDYQSQTISGQYEVAGLIIEFCKKFKVKKIITMGGYVNTNIGETPKVYAAINDPQLNAWIEKLSLEKCEIGSPIVGAAGLLIGLARFNNIQGLCLLGETPGFISDAKAAKALLECIIKLVDLEINLSKLDEMDKDMGEKLERIEEIEKEKEFIKKLKEKFSPDVKDLSYFG